MEEETREKEDCADIVAGEIIDVWRHHFGTRVIDGKEYEEQKDADEDKKMIITKFKIREKVLAVLKTYESVEYESRRLVRRKIFLKSFNLLALIETPNS